MVQSKEERRVSTISGLKFSTCVRDVCRVEMALRLAADDISFTHKLLQARHSWESSSNTVKTKLENKLQSKHKRKKTQIHQQTHSQKILNLTILIKPDDNLATMNLVGDNSSPNLLPWWSQVGAQKCCRSLSKVAVQVGSWTSVLSQISICGHSRLFVSATTLHCMLLKSVTCLCENAGHIYMFWEFN